MADKEAIVYIVDMGKTMGEKRHGRTQTDLDWAMTWVWDKITSIVATERKTLLQGVIGLNTDNTNNEMGEEESYHHLSVLQELSQILLPDLKNLRGTIKPSNTNEGDAISALALALILIDKTCKKLKYRRKIVLVTNGESQMDDNDLHEISKKINQDSIELTILGVDFDDAEYGLKEDGKDPIKKKNEAILGKFAEDCNGAFGTLAQAVEELGEPRIKETRPVPSYRGQLTLGDPQTYPETAIVIDVERYPRTMIRRPQNASSFALAPANGSGAQGETASSDTVMEATEGADGQDQDDLAQVRNQVSYFVEDPEAPNGKLRVERDDLARGYEYGRTAVPVGEVDEGITKLHAKMGLEILGFVPWANYDRYMSMSNSHIVVASRSNSKAILALSSFIHALHELESFAIARLVTKDGKEPTIEALAPSIEPDHECLINVNLPFAEDVRTYRFPPLDRVVTVSGKVIKEHRFLPSDKLMDAMDEYVDSMDLSHLERVSEEGGEEYLTLQDAFSPVLHRIDQAIRWRAVHPGEPVPPPYESLTRHREPSKELMEKNEKCLAKLAAAAEVKKVPPKFVGRRRKEDKKPVSGLDVNALLDGKRKAAIDPNNPIPSLKQMLDQAETPNTINDAATQMGVIIEKRIKDSYGDSNYGRATEEMSALRDEMKDMEEPALWNEFVRGLKEKIFADKLGEGRDEFWFQVRRAKLGLIEGKLPGGGGEVSSEEATQFLRGRPSP